MSADDLQVDESALTGESRPIAKQSRLVEEEKAVPGDQFSMAFSGTIVSRGRGRGITVRTGDASELGMIAEKTKQIGHVKTLGSTTVIGSDKTGTLTANQMTVRAVWTPEHRYEVSGSGYSVDGEISPASEDALEEGDEALHVPFMQAIFNTTPLELNHWLLVIAVGAVVVVASEIDKAFRRRRVSSVKRGLRAALFRDREEQSLTGEILCSQEEKQ